MYHSVSLTVARRNFGKLLDRIERGERIVVTRYGKPFVAIIRIADLQLLVQAKLGMRT